MARREIPLGDILIAAVLTALENDQSRDAVSNPDSLRNEAIFQYAPPSAYLLRQSMKRTDLRDEMADRLYELAACVYDLERWYVFDGTYFKTPYFQKIKDVTVDGKIARKKIKNAKIYIARGLLTGVPVAWTVCDDHTSDQTQFHPLLDQILLRGGRVRGGGILADAFFNWREHYDAVMRAGGRAFLEPDYDFVSSKGLFPHYDLQLQLYRQNKDEWYAFAGSRSLIESTNHAIKTPIKRILRARMDITRENETLALLLAYSLTRIPELVLTYNIPLPRWVDPFAKAFVDKAIKRKRETGVTISEAWPGLVGEPSPVGWESSTARLARTFLQSW